MNSVNNKENGTKLAKIIRMDNIDDTYEKACNEYGGDDASGFQNRLKVMHGMAKFCEGIIKKLCLLG